MDYNQDYVNKWSTCSVSDFKNWYYDVVNDFGEWCLTEQNIYRIKAYYDKHITVENQNIYQNTFLVHHMVLATTATPPPDS